MKNLIFIGAPGAGKGTMAEKLAESTTIQHISTGAILREEISNETELGKAVKNFLEQGALVPDETVANIVAGKLASEEIQANGFILDGFPRTDNQAKILDEMLVKEGVSLDAIVLFDLEDSKLMQRLTGRRVCKACGSTLHHMLFNPPKQEGVCDKCGGELYQRPDDNEETATDRLGVYKKQTMPVIEYYKNSGKMITIDASPSQGEVFSALTATLN